MGELITGWIDEMYGIEVKKQPIARLQGKRDIPFTGPMGKFCTHTGENLKKWEDEQRKIYRQEWSDAEQIAGMQALHTNLKSRGLRPTFTVGGGWIAQHIPVGIQSNTLKPDGEHNREAYIQVECSANTEGRNGLWLLPELTHKPFVALLGFSFAHFGIPARRMGNLPDDMHDMKGKLWATRRNLRRLANYWGKEQGVGDHCLVPDNDHFDAALLMFNQYIQEGAALAGVPVIGEQVQPSPQPSTFVELKRGDKGQRVSWVQGWLLRRGYNLGTSGPNKDGVDGDFGGKTQTAVISFATGLNMTVRNGVVTEAIWNLLKA